VEKTRKRDIQSGLLLTLNVGMTHDLTNLAELSKTYGMKVSELAEQIRQAYAGGVIGDEEALHKEQRFIKRVQNLNLLVHEIKKIAKTMGKV
jgi:predicted transcriptional regulator